VDPYSFTFTLMIRIVSADLPTEVVEIPGLSLAECVDAAREMEKRELVKPGATHCLDARYDPTRPRPHVPRLIVPR
jgi:hypothetical protein